MSRKSKRAAARGTADARRARGREIRRTVAIGMVFTLILVCGQALFEHSFVGRQVELLTYNLVQHRLSLPRDTPLDIVIVDISEIRKEPTENNDDFVVARDALQEIVQAVAAQGPKAIAVDIDFSSTDRQFVTKYDPVFFDSCLLSPVPVFVGVHLTLSKPADQWLGAPEYQRLAATIAAPAPEHELVTTRMPERIRVPPLKTECRSLAGAATERSVPELPVWQRPFVTVVEALPVRQKDLDDGHGLAGGHGSGDADEEPLLVLDQFLVNYAPLEALRHQAIKAAVPTDIDNATVRDRLRDKYVFIGTARLEDTRGLDVFALPEIGLMPGVFVHGSAAYTLLHAPLLQLKPWTRVAIDILSALVVFSLVGWIDFRYGPRRTVATHRLHAVFTGMTVLGTIMIAGWLVPYTRVFWPDFLLVIFSALSHGPVQRTTLRIGRWLRPRVRPAAEAVVFERE